MTEPVQRQVAASSAGPSSLWRAVGGEAWTGWALLSLDLILFQTLRAAPAAAADYLMADFRLDAAALGYLAAATLYLFAAMQPVAGLLTDVAGPRWVAGVGMLVGGISNMAFAFTRSYAAAVVARLGVGLGTSVMFVSLAKYNATWFPPTLFSRIVSFTSSVTHAGAILATFPLAWGLERMGWRLIFFLLGAIAFLAGGATLARVRDGAGGRESAARWGKMLVRVVSNPGTWVSFLTILGLYTPYLAVTGMWGLTYLMQVQGLDRATGTLLLAVPTASVMVTNLVLSQLGDRVGRRWLALGLGGVAFGAWLTLAATGPGAGLRLLVVAFIAIGAGTAAFTLTYPAARDANPPAAAGAAMGVANTGAFLGGALAQPLLGYLLERHWTGEMVGGVRIYPPAAYQDVLLVSAFITLVGAVAGLWLYAGPRVSPADESTVAISSRSAGERGS